MRTIKIILSIVFLLSMLAAVTIIDPSVFDLSFSLSEIEMTCIPWGLFLFAVIIILFLIFLPGGEGVASAGRKNLCVSLDTFKEMWLGSRDLKHHDRPGCYVFTIFRRKPRKNDSSKYKDVYVGQSVNVYARIMQHVTGHGNGDVYADIKAGRYVCVSVFHCKASKLNETEKKLIAAYNATQSYNRTKGGSRVTR